MGTDIHVYVEVWDETAKCWRLVDYNQTNNTMTFIDGFDDPPGEDADDGKYVERIFDLQLDIRRDYWLFAKLANVRNGHGFAGCQTGEPIEPISYPRGLPDDMSTEMKICMEYIEHTPSYLELDEILDADWNFSIEKMGVMSVKEYIKFKESGKATNYSGDVFGGGTKVITEEEFNSLNEECNKDNIYVKTKWTESQEGEFNWFLDIVRNIKKLVNRARLVFYFDS